MVLIVQSDFCFFLCFVLTCFFFFLKISNEPFSILFLQALHDGNSVYFLLQVGGDYAYAKG